MAKRLLVRFIPEISSKKGVLSFIAVMCICASVLSIFTASVFAYFNRGTVTLMVDSYDVVVEQGGTAYLSVQASPGSTTHLRGCGMEECPSVCPPECASTDPETYGDCTCFGTDPVTYSAEINAVSANTGTATARYESGSVVIRGVSEGQTTVVISASLSEHTGASQEINVTVIPSSGGGDGGSGGSDGGGGSGGGQGTEASAPGTAEPVPKKETGVKVTQQQVEYAVQKALSESLVKGDGTNITARIKVPVMEESGAMEVLIPSGSLVPEILGDVDAVSFSSDIAEITLDREVLESAAAGAEENIKIAASKAELKVMNAEIKALIGSRPVLDFSVSVKGKTISRLGGTVKVSIPYAPGEQEDSNAVVAYHIDRAGSLTTMRDCIYDPETQKAVFKTSYLSRFAIGYNKVEFEDVKGWYAEYVTYLAARDIIAPKTGNRFEAAEGITRAELIQMLANMSGHDLSEYTVQVFSDIGETASFGRAAVWANQKGIAQGRGGRFDPGRGVTRQDMAVMLVRYNESTGGNALRSIKKIEAFSDEHTIAANAIDAVNKVCQAGLMSGKKNNAFDPGGFTTRAEAAKVLTLFMKGVME